MRIRAAGILILLLVLGMIPLGKYYYSERDAYVMGSPTRLKVYGYSSIFLVPSALREMKELEDRFSKFVPTGEIGAVNRMAGIAPVKVSEETFNCVKIAERIFRLSGGAFDITLGHPNDLILDKEERRIFIKRKGISLDLGGLGKGYAADHARSLLLKKGAKSGMIDMRSTIAVFGPKKWKIGIEHPRQKGEILGTVSLKDGESLSTSGDYERGGHIIDPRTKKPADLCRSVTVIGTSAAETDALSTAVFILGPVKGLELIDRLPGTEALVVDRYGRILKSKGFNLEKI